MNENANNTNTAPVTPAEQETTVVADNIGTDSQRFVDKVIRNFPPLTRTAEYWNLQAFSAGLYKGIF